MQDQALCPLQRKKALAKEKEGNMETAIQKNMETDQQTD